jgi:hypothetical protein
LDAAIPAPLPMLETLSKIFDGNAVKVRQRFSLKLCNVSKLSALQILLHPREQKKLQETWSSEWGGGTTPILFLAKREAFCCMSISNFMKIHEFVQQVLCIGGSVIANENHKNFCKPLFQISEILTLPSQYILYLITFFAIQSDTFHL